ncbi:hypothetical protein ACFVYJ_08360 [Pontibacter sp. JAM-7]|uniref:hypothetical protein n=1 Tax=Pontibacter sp. JAM-7 TaxID=3366581 RepID=UPI003AF81FCE
MSISDNPMIRRLRPAIVGFSASEAAAIEYFLQRKLDKTAVPVEQANCFMVNGDRYSSLTQLKNEFPKAPQGVVIGLSQHKWPGYHWVCKPYTSGSLSQALLDMAHELDTSLAAEGYDTHQGFSIERQTAALKHQLEQGDLTVSASDRLIAQLGGQHKSALADLVASVTDVVTAEMPAVTSDIDLAELEFRCCGDAEDVDLDDLKKRQQITFNADGYILNLLKHLVSKGEEMASPVILKGDRIRVVYQPESREFVHEYTDDFLLELAQQRFRFGELLIETPEAASLVAFVEAGRSTNKVAFLWQMALWSARGRLLVGLDPQQPYVLRQQPEAAHLLSLDCFHQIADIWLNHSLSVVDIIRILDLPQRQVFAFASAAYFLGWLDAESYTG